MQRNASWIYFDFDGLLADTEPMHMKAFDLAFEKLGIAAKSNPEKWVGKSTREILGQVIRDTGTNVSLDEIRKVRRNVFRQISSQARLMPHAKETLAKLSEKHALALVTSSGRNEIGPLLDKRGLTSFFEVMVFAEDVERLKPFPDLYLKAQEKAETVGGFAVEDSERGVKAAKSAGLFCIAIPNQYTKNQDLTQADWTFTDLKEAGTFLAKLP